MRVTTVYAPLYEKFRQQAGPDGAYYKATGVAPHADTTRFTYNPASYQTGILKAVFIKARRATQATTVGRVRAYVVVNNFIPGDTPILEVDFVDNTVAVIYRAEYACDIQLNAIQYVSAHTYDLSTGGTMDYDIGVVCDLYNM